MTILVTPPVQPMENTLPPLTTTTSTTPDLPALVPELPALSEAVPPVKEEATVVPPVTDPASTIPVEDEEYDIETEEGSPLTDADLDEIAEEAGRLNLSKADAQKLVTLKENGYKNGASSEVARITAQHQENTRILMADPMFSESPEVAKHTWESIEYAVESFGDPELVKMLNTPGIGDQLPIAKFLKKIGDLIRPATEVPLGKGSITAPAKSAEDSQLEALYPIFFKDAQK